MRGPRMRRLALVAAVVAAGGLTATAVGASGAPSADCEYADRNDPRCQGTTTGPPGNTTTGPGTTTATTPTTATPTTTTPTTTTPTTPATTTPPPPPPPPDPPAACECTATSCPAVTTASKRRVTKAKARQRRRAKGRAKAAQDKKDPAYCLVHATLGDSVTSAHFQQQTGGWEGDPTYTAACNAHDTRPTPQLRLGGRRRRERRLEDGAQAPCGLRGRDGQGDGRGLRQRRVRRCGHAQEAARGRASERRASCSRRTSSTVLDKRTLSGKWKSAPTKTGFRHPNECGHRTIAAAPRSKGATVPKD